MNNRRERKKILVKKSISDVALKLFLAKGFTDTTVAEIMEAAKRLFYKKGYLNTTTQDIIDTLNISRGLLYYHFKSKEDILFSIVEKHIAPIVSQFNAITHDENLPAKDKVVSFLNSTIISESSAQEEDYALQDAIQLPENTFMMDKINSPVTTA